MLSLAKRKVIKEREAAKTKTAMNTLTETNRRMKAAEEKTAKKSKELKTTQQELVKVGKRAKDCKKKTHELEAKLHECENKTPPAPPPLPNKSSIKPMMEPVPTHLVEKPRKVNKNYNNLRY